MWVYIMLSKNLFIGVGGSGVNTVSRLINSGMRGAFLCISQRGEIPSPASENVVRIALPETISFPISEPWISKIRAQMDKANRVFLFVGLGGLTGTSLAIQLSQMREMEIHATYPFALERKRRKIADEALSKIKGKMHLRHNDEFIKHPEMQSMPMNEYFRMMDEQVCVELKREIGD